MSRDLWYCGAVEPNAWGANQIRRTWWHALHAGRLAAPSRHTAPASARARPGNRSRPLRLNLPGRDVTCPLRR